MKRKHSENRQRTALVALRLLPAEKDALVKGASDLGELDESVPRCPPYRRGAQQ